MLCTGSALCWAEASSRQVVREQPVLNIAPTIPSTVRDTRTPNRPHTRSQALSSEDRPEHLVTAGGWVLCRGGEPEDDAKDEHAGTSVWARSQCPFPPWARGMEQGTRRRERQSFCVLNRPWATAVIMTRL